VKSIIASAYVIGGGSIVAFFDAAGGEALSDALAASGPTLGGLGTLAFFLYKWLAEIKTQVATLQGKLEAATNTDASLRVDIAELRGEIREHSRRIDVLERPSR
jgi:hypothetical protein